MKRKFLVPICGLAMIVCSCNKPTSSSEATVATISSSDTTVSVTSENFAEVMTDMAMQKEFLKGADNTWNHHRKPMPLDEQPAPLMNRDTEYSFAILDGGGDVAITLPPNDGRYMSLHIMNHNHVTYKVFYGPGKYVIPADSTSDFFYANVRMQVNAGDPADIKKVNDYQDQLKVEFLNGYKPRSFKATKWNMEEFKNVHAQYIALAKKDGVGGTMGTINHQVATEDKNRGAALATGLLPDKDAVYITAQYSAEPGKIYKATYQVPGMTNSKLGFYSITMYGTDQHLKTDEGSTISNTELKLNPGGKSFDLYYVPKDQFDKDKHTNKLLIPESPYWICFRVYLPVESVIIGDFKLPEPK